MQLRNCAICLHIHSSACTILISAASREFSSRSAQATGTAGHAPSYCWRPLNSSASAWRPAPLHLPAGCIPWNCGCTNSQSCAPRRSRPTAIRRPRPQLTHVRRPRPQPPLLILTALAAARSGRFLGPEHAAARCSGCTPCAPGDSPAPQTCLWHCGCSGSAGKPRSGRRPPPVIRLLIFHQQRTTLRVITMQIMSHDAALSDSGERVRSEDDTSAPHSISLRVGRILAAHLPGFWETCLAELGPAAAAPNGSASSLEPQPQPAAQNDGRVSPPESAAAERGTCCSAILARRRCVIRRCSE